MARENATREHRQFDTLLEMKDAGLVAASAAATVGGSAKILDLGEGLVDADLLIEVTAVEVDTGDEIYQIGFQLSSEADFASTIKEAATLKLGDAAALPGDVDMDAGRYILGVRNEVAGTKYRYARLYTTVAGTIATGINFTARLAKRTP